MGVMPKMGVMFPESTYAQGVQVRVPVEHSFVAHRHRRRREQHDPDEREYADRRERGAVALFVQFSDQLGQPVGDVHVVHRLPNVCSLGSGDCTASAALLAPSGDIDGLGWSLANKVGTFTNIGGGQSFTIEGSYPFSNSAHPGGCNMGFCDGGVRFISNTIDGTVYSKIITPAGSRLPIYLQADARRAGRVRQLIVWWD